MAADLAVQLRTGARGETSAAVLDCMNYGLPTIVNGNGSFFELPADTVWMLPDVFHDSELTKAIDTLWFDSKLRESIGMQGQYHVQKYHALDVCSDHYVQEIESKYAISSSQKQEVIQAHNVSSSLEPSESQFVHMAQSLACKMPPLSINRQLLIDVSAIYRNDLKTGIQRVVRALVWSLIQAPPEGFRVEPVYLEWHTGVWHYCYAREWTSQALSISGGWMPNDPVDYADGDVLLIADFTSGLAVEANLSGVFATLKELGVDIYFFVYDLLPIQMPHCFPPCQFGYIEWLKVLTAISDKAICISNAVARDLQSWMCDFGPKRGNALVIDSFRLGADLVNSIPSSGLPPDSGKILSKLQAAISFLMVGTLEPRKGYLQTLQAFTQMWRSGMNFNLIIVGCEGWKALPNSQRQTIPQIVKFIQTHPELGKRLLWLTDVSDEYLAQLYSNSKCLIAASEGEGFGLPLIEAAQHALPIIARDIPVFREVAGDNAFYFNGLEAKDLEFAIKNWLILEKQNKHPKSHAMPWLTWAQSTKCLIEILQLSPRQEASAISTDGA